MSRQRRDPTPRIQALVLGSILLSLFAAAVALRTDAQHIAMSIADTGPTLRHWVGTDGLGRDVLERTIAATPLSIGLALFAVLIAGTLGVAVGGAVAVVGLRGRDLLARGIELSLTFPSLLLALLLVTLIGPGPVGAAVAVGVAMAPGFARTAQTVAAAVADADYVAAARLLGVNRMRLLLRYVLPNIADPLIVKAAVTAGGALTAISGLSFLGFGVQPPAYDWGRMLSEGLRSLYLSPFPALLPGLAITLAGLGFNLLGDRIAARFNPNHRKARAVANSTGRIRTQASPVHVADTPLLMVRDLCVTYPGPVGPQAVLVDIDLDIKANEAVGLVGESGCGKSTLALALAGLLPHDANVSQTALRFDGVDLLAATPRSLATLFGLRLGFVFQDAFNAFNPRLSLGTQLAERLQVHKHLARGEALVMAEAKLRQVGVSAPERRVQERANRLSGGMRQRALIAMGLLTRPGLLIADEPTTALDVTIQAQVIDLLRRLKSQDQCAILFVSHDLAVVSQLCTRLVVMYAGSIVEIAPIERLVAKSLIHPYSQALLASVLAVDGRTKDRLDVIAGAASEVMTSTGCPFAPRCPKAFDICNLERPRLASYAEHARVACWAVPIGETP